MAIYQMDLKTINEVRELPSSEAVAYATEVSANTSSLNSSEVVRLFSDVRQECFECPTPDFVSQYVLAFIVEHLEDIVWRVHPIEELGCFSDTDLWVFHWITVGHSVAHFLFLDASHKDAIVDTLTAVEAGVSFDALSSATIPLLEEDTAQFTQYTSLLIYLGVIHSNTEAIPPLSATLNVDESTARFSSAIWYEEIQKKTIVLAGLGGIGSYVAFLLARMHPRSMFLYDDDRVELVNMAGQLYRLEDVGKYKVDAIANTIREYSSYSSVFAIRERFTEENEAADIMICGFDNMIARRDFFNRWLAHVTEKGEEEKKRCLFIDGRLAAEELQVLCMRGDDSYNIERYNSDFLFSDDEADETLCSYKQTTYMANMIGSIMVNLFTNFVANQIVDNLRDLPFFTSYSADSMVFKSEQ